MPPLCFPLLVKLPSLVGTKDFADVVFHIGNHALYAHRCVIEARCPPLFAVAIKDRGKKGALTTLKSDEKLVDIRSLSLVLEYLYTGSVPFSDVSPAEVISLIAHTELYQIVRLRWLCERYLQAVLTDDLFFTLMLVSDISGVARAKTLCMQYGATHFEKLIVKRDQVATLGIELFREFVVFATLNNEVLEDLNQMSFPNTIRDEFKIIYTAMANPDAFFSFKAANTTIPCHRAILYAQTDKFKTLFLDEVNQAPAEGRYTLPKNVAMPPEAFRSFLTWVYYRDTSFSAAHAAQMLPLAHEFGINPLIEECEGKLRKGISVHSVIPILVLCFSEWGKKSYKQELAKPCLDFLILNFAKVDLSTPRSAAINAAIAESVRTAVLTGIWKPISGDHNSSSAPISSATLADSDAAASESEATRTKKKNRKTLDIEIYGGTEDSTTDSVNNTPKASHRKSKVLSESSEAHNNGSTEEAEPTSPKSPSTPSATTTEESTTAEQPKAVEETKPEVEKPAEESTTKEDEKSEETPAASAPATTAAEPLPEKPAPVPAIAALEREANGSPKVFRRQGSSQTSKSSPKSARSAEKAEKAEKAEREKAEKAEREKAEKAAAAAEKAEKAERERAEKAEKEREKERAKAAAAAEKAELKVAEKEAAAKREVSPSTAEKRAALETRTSVKAIKETFEQKSKEDLAEKEAANNRAARRRSVRVENNLESSGSDQGSKRVV